MAGAVPAGWYPQPDGTQRYWDGLRWTEHVVPAAPAPATRQTSVPRTAQLPAVAEAAGGEQGPGYEPPFNRDDPRWDSPGYGQQVAVSSSLSGPAQGRWCPDPFGRRELRWWDGHAWTQHVVSQGRQGIDPPGSPAQPANHKVQQQVRALGLMTEGAPQGSGPLFTEPILVVNQKAKLFEVNAEYAVFDQHGRQVGAVRQVGENFMRKTLASVPDASRTRRLEILDLSGRVVMKLVRPAKVVKSTVTVSAGDGSPLGQIVQENTRALGGIVKGAVGLIDRVSPVNLEEKIGHLGNVRFSLRSGDQTLGSIEVEDRGEWDFRIQDAAGTEVARITRTWAGLAREWFTKADNYVVQIHRPLGDPLRALVVAAALAVDTVFRQDAD